jgi:peptidoglycan/LPS O-acetylase OafA/YrhL
MLVTGSRRFTFWQWAILFGLLSAAIVVSEVSGFKQEWEDGVVYTVVLFAVVIMALRPAWGRRRFLKNLAFLFALHVVGMIVLLSVVPLGRFGVPKLVWGMACIAEALLIASVLWKRAVRSRMSTGPRHAPEE